MDTSKSLVIGRTLPRTGFFSMSFYKIEWKNYPSNIFKYFFIYPENHQLLHAIYSLCTGIYQIGTHTVSYTVILSQMLLLYARPSWSFKRFHLLTIFFSRHRHYEYFDLYYMLFIYRGEIEHNGKCLFQLAMQVTTDNVRTHGIHCTLVSV